MCEILAEELVPGDILVLQEGDNISADARLIEDSELRVNAATLTGESETGTKNGPAGLGRRVDRERDTEPGAGGTSVSGLGKAAVYSTGMKPSSAR